MRRRFTEETISRAVKMLLNGTPAQKVLSILKKDKTQKSIRNKVNDDFEMIEQLELEAVEIANRKIQRQIDQ